MTPTRIAIGGFAAAAGLAMMAALFCSGSGVADVSAAPSAFKDCANCPEMVVVAAGEFMMGSPADERYRGAELQHRVVLPAFAAGKYEVTFEEWDACVADGGCDAYRPDDQGWGRGKRPVTNISWNDAANYVAWLSRKTGKSYRLLSEAEWEYAARAGVGSAFSTGGTLTTEQANFDGSSSLGANRQQTMPVGSFPANAFGLHDMHGNVWEWVADCWHDEYTPAVPADGSAWVEPGCKGHVMRGGSWEDYIGELRSAARTGGANEDQFYTDGLRVALSL